MECSAHRKLDLAADPLCGLNEVDELLQFPCGHVCVSGLSMIGLSLSVFSLSGLALITSPWPLLGHPVLLVLTGDGLLKA